MSKDYNEKDNIADDDIEESGNGPMKERGITDCICCILMLAFWGYTIFLMAYGFSKGDPWKLIQTFDHKGRMCGDEATGTEEYKRAYFYQPLNGLENVVCVKTCPSWQEGEAIPLEVECFDKEKEDHECKFTGEFTFDKMDETTSLSFKGTEFLIYNTTSILERFCVPHVNDPTEYAKSLAKNITIATQLADQFEEYFSDVRDSWKYMIYVSLISIALSLISLLIIRYLAGFFTWLIILLFLIAIFGLAVVCLRESNRLESIAEQEQVTDDDNNTYYTSKNLYILSIVLFILGGIAVLIVLFSISSIALSIAVVKTAALYVANNFFIIFLPIIIAVINIAYIIAWAVSFLYIWSVGEIEQREGIPVNNIKWTTQTRAFVISYFFSLFWNVAFINYIGVFIIGCSCSIWYFNRNDDGEAYHKNPILTSMWWAFRYHLGSIAFGAFILAVIWIIQVILAYITKQVNDAKAKGVESRVVDCFLKCMMYCVACFERAIKFLSKLGFIQVAISSRNFCVSCIKAGSLLLTNPMKFGFVLALGEIFVFIGKMFVSSLCGVIGYLMISADSELDAKLYSKVVPVILFVLIGYIVASIFFSTYGVAADAILLCFFWSKERAAKIGRPVNPPAPMQEFYERYKKDD